MQDHHERQIKDLFKFSSQQSSGQTVIYFSPTIGFGIVEDYFRKGSFGGKMTLHRNINQQEKAYGEERGERGGTPHRKGRDMLERQKYDIWKENTTDIQ